MVMTSVRPRFSEGGIDTDSERDAALKAKQNKAKQTQLRLLFILWLQGV
jgi:hypothetical protein